MSRGKYEGFSSCNSCVLFLKKAKVEKIHNFKIIEIGATQMYYIVSWCKDGSWGVCGKDVMWHHRLGIGQKLLLEGFEDRMDIASHLMDLGLSTSCPEKDIDVNKGIASGLRRLHSSSDIRLWDIDDDGKCSVSSHDTNVFLNILGRTFISDDLFLREEELERIKICFDDENEYYDCYSKFAKLFRNNERIIEVNPFKLLAKIQGYNEPVKIKTDIVKGTSPVKYKEYVVEVPRKID